jgi:hypothetical protein
MHQLRPELLQRVVAEEGVVRAAFPGRFRLVLTANNLLAWEGSVPVEGRDFPVRLTYPRAYPAVPPLLATTAVLPDLCPHLLARDAGSATLCWIAPGGGFHPRGRWDPAHHTAATALRAAQRWALAFLVWQVTGVWPVPDAWER